MAENDGRIVSTYTLKPVQPGLGNHIANCGYMTHPDARHRGIADALCTHSLATRASAATAMQFNFVVASNSVRSGSGEARFLAYWVACQMRSVIANLA